MGRRACTLFLILLAAATTLAACGGDDGSSDAADLADAIEDAQDGALTEDELADLEEQAEDLGGDGGGGSGSGSCSVTVSGDVEASWEAQKDQGSIGSDYFYSDEDLELLGAGAEDGGFVFYGLVLNCDGDDGAGFSVLSSGDATRDDLPFEPGTYPIDGGLGAGDGALFGSVLSLGNGNDVALMQPVSGTIDITRFEESGFEATVSLELESAFGTESRTGTLEASFSYDCSDRGCE
jgi:hypothetical protein